MLPDTESWDQMGSLDGQTAIVTGAGTGIGVGIARHLAAAGASLVLSAYNSFAGCEQLQRELSAAGTDAVAIKVDLRGSSDAAQLADAAVERWGRIDVLVNNAGYTLAKPFVECSERDWDDLFSINLRSMFVTCRAAVPAMIERGYGRIINISSVHGVQHIQNLVLYGATKGGINEFTRGLAVELGPHGITANVIAPGAIYVPRYDRVGADKATMAATVPNGQLGDVDDIGRTAAFLADPAAAYISGEILYVDGGLTSKMALTGGARRA